jgi:hypothetical protein
LLVPSAAASCSSTGQAEAVDSGGGDDATASGDDAAPPSDDGGAADGRTKAIQGVGSKCLTSCPMNLMCDPYKWKGFCTKPCMTDNDCQGTGDPPVVGVCGDDKRCYKSCDPASDPCTRLEWVCVGEAGRMYCNNYYDAHYDKPDAGGD